MPSTSPTAGSCGCGDAMGRPTNCGRQTTQDLCAALTTPTSAWMQPVAATVRFTCWNGCCTIGHSQVWWFDYNADHALCAAAGQMQHADWHHLVSATTHEAAMRGARSAHPPCICIAANSIVLNVPQHTVLLSFAPHMGGLTPLGNAFLHANMHSLTTSMLYVWLRMSHLHISNTSSLQVWLLAGTTLCGATLPQHMTCCPQTYDTVDSWIAFCVFVANQHLTPDHIFSG